MKPFATTILAFGIMLAALPAAHADTTTCNTTITGGTVSGNLIVPPGATCTLVGVTVTGNVQVQENATLMIYLYSPPSGFNIAENSTIDGNVQVGVGASLSTSEPFGVLTIAGNLNADQCSSVGLVNPIVDGNVRISNCTGPFENEYIGGEIGGNFDCSGNSAGCILQFGKVNGNVMINNNNHINGNGDAPNVVAGNTIGGNLQCQGNTAITDVLIVAEPNIVGDHKQGQCAGF
jgi:hypothetical protein